MSYYVFLDASVILDFSEPKDDGIFQKLKEFITSQEHSEFFTTEYIAVLEINNSPYLEDVKKHIKIYEIPIEHLLTNSPPQGIDLGEWSIFLAIGELVKKEKKCCVLCSDKAAREFFKTNSLLPCKHINPPPGGVGGTLGILEHLYLIGIIVDSEKENIINKMKQAGRRL